MYWCDFALFRQNLTSLFTFICFCTHNPCTYYHVLLLEDLGVIETHFLRRLRTFAGVSNCSREESLRKLNLQIRFLKGSEANSITEDTKNSCACTSEDDKITQAVFEPILLTFIPLTTAADTDRLCFCPFHNKRPGQQAIHRVTVLPASILNSLWRYIFDLFLIWCGQSESFVFLRINNFRSGLVLQGCSSTFAVNHEVQLPFHHAEVESNDIYTKTKNQITSLIETRYQSGNIWAYFHNKP